MDRQHPRKTRPPQRSRPSAEDLRSDEMTRRVPPADVAAVRFARMHGLTPSPTDQGEEFFFAHGQPGGGSARRIGFVADLATGRGNPSLVRGQHFAFRRLARLFLHGRAVLRRAREGVHTATAVGEEGRRTLIDGAAGGAVDCGVAFGSGPHVDPNRPGRRWRSRAVWQPRARAFRSRILLRRRRLIA